MPGHALADSGNGQERLFVLVDFSQGAVQALNGLGGAAVGAYAKRVFGRDLHQVGGLVKNGGDGFVVHESNRNSKCLLKPWKHRGTPESERKGPIPGGKMKKTVFSRVKYSSP